MSVATNNYWQSVKPRNQTGIGQEAYKVFCKSMIPVGRNQKWANVPKALIDAAPLDETDVVYSYSNPENISLSKQTKNTLDSKSLNDFEFSTLVNLFRSQSCATINIKKNDTNTAVSNLVISPNRATSSSTAHPNVFINVGESARSQIKISLKSLPNTEELFINTLINIKLESHASLDLYLENTPKNIKQIMDLQVTLGEHSKINILIADNESAFVRKRVNADLIGKNSSFNINCLSLARGNQSHHYHVEANHRHSSTKSKQLFRSVANDSALVDVYTKSAILNQAIQSDSSQLAKGILLSTKSRITVKPILVIKTDDVTANHGVAIGPLDDDELHYIRTRGISNSEAHHLLLSGFLLESINKIEHSEWREEITLMANAALNN